MLPRITYLSSRPPAAGSAGSPRGPASPRAKLWLLALRGGDHGRGASPILSWSNGGVRDARVRPLERVHLVERTLHAVAHVVTESTDITGVEPRRAHGTQEPDRPPGRQAHDVCQRAADCDVDSLLAPEGAPVVMPAQLDDG